jgi:FkbM family methyltransferase
MNFNYRRIKNRIKIFLRRELNYDLQIKKVVKWFGTRNAGFYVSTETLDKDSIVYSFGIGEDISFDEELIKGYDLKVYGFDPTPKAIQFITSKKLNGFSFYKFGIHDSDGLIEFYLPPDPNHVSGTISNRWNYDVDKLSPIEVPVKKFSTIAKELGHSKIEILKMDIEGSEYTVLDDILSAGIDIRQILIEFHHRFSGHSLAESILAVKKLNENGYKIMGISESLEEYSFIKSS